MSLVVDGTTQSIEDMVRTTKRGLLVTFFGSGFDLPVLRHAFPQVRFDVLHIDLCYSLKRLGYSGGLKRVESALAMVAP